MEGILDYLYPEDENATPDSKFWFNFSNINVSSIYNLILTSFKDEQTPSKIQSPLKPPKASTTKSELVPQKRKGKLNSFTNQEFMMALARVLFKKASETIVPKTKLSYNALVQRFDSDYSSVAGTDTRNFVAVQKEKGYIHYKDGRVIAEALVGDFADLLFFDDNYYLYNSTEKAIYKKKNDKSEPSLWLKHTGPNTIFSKSMRVSFNEKHLLINEKAKRVRCIDLKNPEKNFSISFKTKAKSKMLCHQALPNNRVAMMYYNGMLEVHSYNSEKQTSKFESSMSAIESLSSQNITLFEYAYSFAMNEDCTLLAVSIGRGGYLSRISVFKSDTN
jgi:hypothetical protein